MLRASRPTNDILPAMTFETYPTFAFPRPAAHSYTNEYQFLGNFTWSKGTHIVKFGILHSWRAGWGSDRISRKLRVSDCGD